MTITSSAEIIRIDSRPSKGKSSSNRKPKPTRAERFEAMVDRSAGPDACHPFTGSINQGHGYGQFYDVVPSTGNKIMRAAHAVAFELHRGHPVAPGMFVLHARGCKRTCCNPRHLREGTHAENMADALAEGRLGKRITKAQALEIVHLVNTVGASIDAVATRFGVRSSSIREILRGRTHSKTTGIEYVKSKGGRPKAVTAIEIVPTIVILADKRKAKRRAVVEPQPTA